MCPAAQGHSCCSSLKSALVSCHTGSFFTHRIVVRCVSERSGHLLSETAQFLHFRAFTALFSRRHYISRLFPLSSLTCCLWPSVSPNQHYEKKNLAFASSFVVPSETLSRLCSSDFDSSLYKPETCPFKRLGCRRIGGVGQVAVHFVAFTPAKSVARLLEQVQVNQNH